MNIKNKEELKEYIKYEKNLYFINTYDFFKSYIYHDNNYFIWKYLKANRIMEFYYNKKNITKGFRKYYYIFRYILKKKEVNKFGIKTGFEIYINTVKKGLKIYHYGNVIINGNAKIGENVQIHGSCCIGNKGKEYDNLAPKIGNNVDIGINAILIGNIEIADNVKIGAGAVVSKSFKEKGLVLVGVPAKHL